MLRWLIDGMPFLFSSGYEKLILCALLFNYFDYSLSNKLMELKFLLPIWLFIHCMFSVLQYLDIKKDDLPDIVADYDSQQAAPENSKHNKKSRCAIM